MSEFTYGNIASVQHKNRLQHVFPKGTAVCQLNEEWIAFFTDQDSEMGSSSYMINISNECPVLYFYNLEDHCWGYEIWNRGDRKSFLHIPYEMETELLFKIAGERYPEIDHIVAFLYEEQEGQRIAEEIREQLRDHAFYEAAVSQLFESVHIEDFHLFDVSEEVLEGLDQLLNANTYLLYDNKQVIVEEFKQLLNLEEMSWLRFDRIDPNEHGFEMI